MRARPDPPWRCSSRHDGIWVDLAQRSLALDDQPMGEHGDSQLLHVVRDDVVAPFERGERLTRSVQVQRTARRRAEVDVRVLAGGRDQPDDVLGHGLVDVDLLDPRLHLAQLFQVKCLAQVVDRVQALLLVQDHDLLHRLGIAKAEAEHEPIELRLG